MKFTRLATGIAAAVFATGGFAAPASATPAAPTSSSTSPGATSEVLTLTEADEAQLRGFFDEYDVDAAVQDSLIARIESGKPWLSLTKGAKPVSERVEVNDDMKERISTYADGSIAVSGMEIPAPPAASGTMSTMSVGGCSTSSTAYKSTYTNCLADVNLGVVRMYFRFNWQKTYGVSATITGFNPDSYGGHCIGCSLSDNRVYRISSTDVRYAATSSVAWDGSPIQMTAYMGARTSLANGAYTYHN